MHACSSRSILSTSVHGENFECANSNTLLNQARFTGKLSLPAAPKSLLGHAKMLELAESKCVETSDKRKD